MDFNFFLFSNNTNGSISLLSSNEEESNAMGSSILTNNTEDNSCGFDAFGGKDIFGNPDYSAFEGSFIAEGAPAETIGSVARAAETIGSIAQAAETIGSVACGFSSDSSSTGFSGFSGGGFSSGSSCGSASGFTSVC